MVKENKPEIFDPFKQLRKSFFDDFFEPMKGLTFPEIRSPLVNIEDKGKKFELKAEMPGISKEGLLVDAHKDYIKLEGNTNKEKKSEKKNYCRYESKSSSFSRVIPMPEEIVPEKVSGELKNGILKLTAPKAKPKTNEGTKRIKIK